MNVGRIFRKLAKAAAVAVAVLPSIVQAFISLPVANGSVQARLATPTAGHVLRMERGHSCSRPIGGWKTPAPLVQAIVNGNGGIVNRYAYDSFGVIDWDWSYETVPNRYTFQGREYDAERGDYHFRNRIYFPEWGLFSGPDMNLAAGPYGEPYGMMSYVFCGNDPWTYGDPMGLHEFSYAFTGGDQDFSVLSFVGAFAPPPPRRQATCWISAAQPRLENVYDVYGKQYLQSPSTGKMYSTLYEARQDGCKDSIEAPPSDRGTLGVNLYSYYLRTGQPTKADDLAHWEGGLILASITPLPFPIVGGRVGVSSAEKVAATVAERRVAAAMGAKAAQSTVMRDAFVSVAPKKILPRKLYAYTDNATAALVEKSQLGLPGRIIYLTPNGNLTPLQAQIELALPQENTAMALFEVSTESLDASKVLIQRRVTGNVYNRGGGGIEILFDGTIPLENLKRIR